MRRSGVEGLRDRARTWSARSGRSSPGRRIQFEAPHVSYDTYSRLHDAGVELIAVGHHVGSVAASPVEELRRGQGGQGRSTRCAARLPSRTRLYAGARRPALHRPHGARARVVDRVRVSRRSARMASRSRAIWVAAGENGAFSARLGPGDRHHRGGHARDHRRRLCRRRLLLGLHPNVRDRRAFCRARAGVRTLPAGSGRTGFAAVQVGARTGEDVDAASRVEIAAAGLGERYGHGLGHGVGLDVHEAPVLRAESEDTLAAGNIVTVEPGIYLHGVGGVRCSRISSWSRPTAPSA